MPQIATQMDPFYVALSRLRQKRYDECIELCTDILQENPYDQVRISYSLTILKYNLNPVRLFGLRNVEH